MRKSTVALGLAAIVGAGYLFWRASSYEIAEREAFDPFDGFDADRPGPSAVVPDTALPAVAYDASLPSAAWVAPVDGACPDGYPVKAKLTSGIFHVPGGRNYDRTAPDRCYRDAEAATADGLRPARA